MIGFCNKLNMTIISEADCHKCKYTDLTCCRYWRESKEVDKIKVVKELIEEKLNSFPDGYTTETIVETDLISFLLDIIKFIRE